MSSLFFSVAWRLWRLRFGGVAFSLLFRAVMAQEIEKSIDLGFEGNDRVIISAHVVEMSSSRLERDPIVETSDVKLLRDGESFGMESVRASLSQPKNSVRQNFVYRGDEAIVINSGMEGGKPVIRRGGHSTSLHSPRISGSVEAKRQFDQLWPTDGNIDPLCFGVLDGVPILQGDGMLANLTKDESGGNVMYRSGSRYGQLEIQVLDGVPRTISLTQLPEHVSRGRKIADIVMNGGSVWPAGRILRMQRNVTLDFEPVASPQSPRGLRGWKSVTETHCEQGVVVRQVIDVNIVSREKLSQVQPSDFWFGLQIPKDNSIQVNEAGHLPYRWDGDWARPDTQTLAGAKQKAPTRRASWLLFGNVTILVVFVGLIWWRKRSSSRA